jgi:alpha/beta superfamily hydrolase
MKSLPFAGRGHAHAAATKASGPSAGGTRVEFQNLKKEKLVGRFIDARSQEVVILCHGYASTKDSPIIAFLAKELSGRQISTLRFDFAGNGESQGVFQFANYMSEVQDLRCAVIYVREVLHKTVTAIVGHSKGGNVVLLYGAAFDDVPLIVNVCGRFDLTRGIVERYGEETIEKLQKLGQVEMEVRTDGGSKVKFMLTKQDLHERRSINMQEACQKITIAEVLTVHGTDDQTVPVEDAQAFSRCIRQHQLQLVNGGDHNFKSPQHAEAAVKKIIAYICSGL